MWVRLRSLLSPSFTHVQSMHESPPTRTWMSKFSDAFRGVGLAVQGSSSFYVHVMMAIAVFVAAAVFQVSRTEWCLLILCITTVMAAEAFNSAIEWLAKAVDREHNPVLGNALDIASGAVLICAFGAATVGVLILGYHARAWLGFM